MTNDSRRFHLERAEDLSGLSGTGMVAWGIEFPDGTCALRWNTKIATSVTYDCVEHVEWLHGHEGRTKVIFDD
jgi:hypothetical protein